MELMGIRFAPLCVPLERRLQTLAAACWFVTFAMGPFIALLATIYMILYTRLSLFVLLYIAWIVYDRDTASKGGRRLEWMRSWRWWHYFCQYFPLNLHKTEDLPADRTYMLCCFPHGMLCAGIFGNFATNYSSFAKLFPGLTITAVTISMQFFMPFTRELMFGLGGCSASRDSMLYLLNDKSVHRAVALVVGGAAEAFNCRPGPYRIILKRRKGFVRLALETGTPLVPVFSFGETRLFDQVSNPPGSWIYTIQNTFRKAVGFTPCIPLGRGMLQYSFGVVPHRYPVHTVIGKPIYVEKVANPTTEQIDALHETFTKALTALFEENKHKYEQDPQKASLIID